MLILDTTSKSITVQMSGAAATTNPSFVTAYSDDNGTTFVEGSSDGTLNGTTQVTLVASPAASTRRLIKTIYIENGDTAPVTITVTLNNSGTLRTIAKVTLQVGDTWSTDGTTDTNGNFKGIGSSGYSGAQGTSGYSGISGWSGQVGASGTSGYSGYSGSGISGYSGFSGYSGAAPTGSANTWTATQTFNGSSSTLAAVLLDAAEVVNITSSAIGSTQALSIQSGSVVYYTTSAANNWTIDITFNFGSSVLLNSVLSVGQSVTVALLVTQGSTAYYNTTVQVDNTTSGVTTYWQGGNAPSKGNASGIDVYTYTVIKTASATFTVLASQTQF